MVAVDNSALFGLRKVPPLKFALGPLVAGLAMVAVALVLGAIAARGFSENGFRLGSQLAWRYTSFVFFAALVASFLAVAIFRSICSHTSASRPRTLRPSSASISLWLRLGCSAISR